MGTVWELLQCCNRFFDGFWSQRLGKAHLENYRVLQSSANLISLISSISFSVIWDHVISCYIISCYVMLCHVISCYIMLYHHIYIYISLLPCFPWLRGFGRFFHGSARVSTRQACFFGPKVICWQSSRTKPPMQATVHKIWRVDWSVELHQLHQLHQLMSWWVGSTMIHNDPLWSMDGRSKELDVKQMPLDVVEISGIEHCSMNFSRWSHAESRHHESRATEPLAPGHFWTFLEGLEYGCDMWLRITSDHESLRNRLGIAWYFHWYFLKVHWYFRGSCRPWRLSGPGTARRRRLGDRSGDGDPPWRRRSVNTKTGCENCVKMTWVTCTVNMCKHV